MPLGYCPHDACVNYLPCSLHPPPSTSSPGPLLTVPTSALRLVASTCPPAPSVAAPILLRGRIESDLASLDALCERVCWTPNSVSVRPSPERMDDKKRLFENVASRFASIRDYILARIFHLRTSPVSLSFANQHVCVSDEALAEAREEAKTLPGGWKVKFLPNMFPYQVIEGTYHYVLWFLLNPSGLPSERDVNAALERAFAELEVSDQVEFVWYKNPKPTINDVDLTHHVQVFWRLLPKL